jgi:oligopeptide/dipeptide ABC transporter ATP-binding protein
LNEKALEVLDREFMKEFLVLTAKALKYSNAEALEKKKKAISDLKEALAFYQGTYAKADAVKQAKTVSAAVKAGIDPLEIHKDNRAYTFETSVNDALNKYFHYQVQNPKEEARFAKQTAKREALIAKGRTVDWKVVPKNVMDLDLLKGNVESVVSNMLAHYEKAVSDFESIDFDARSIELIDYFKDRASRAVYIVTKAMAKEKAIRLMEEVGISEPRMRYYQYPFEFSGGMRQRIVIAIALTADPEILICDEPTTALDVTIQAQILELINKLKKERNLSIIFITHDLGVVANMADDIAVMYAGKIVEYGTANEIFYDPRHPYTWALLSSMPDLDTKDTLDAIPGTPPNMIYPPVGDAFAERNKYAMKIDFEKQPPMFPITETHSAATWLLHPDAPKVEIPEGIRNRIARMREKNARQKNLEQKNGGVAGNG